MAAMDLAALIRRDQDNTGSSYADIARRSGLSKAKIGQLANPTRKYQARAETVEKLAKGLGVPLVVAQRAALVTAGVIGDEAAGRDGSFDLLLKQLEQLDDKTLAMVAAMVDTAVKFR